MTDVTTSDAHTPPGSGKCPFSPPAKYRELREAGPAGQIVLASGMTVWALSRLEDIRAMLTDSRFSANRHHENFPRFMEGQQVDPNFGASILGMDPPEHTEARREVLGEFTVQRLKRMQPRVQSIVNEHVDQLLAGPRPTDLVKQLCVPVPSQVISELIGVPFEDLDFFKARTSCLLDSSAAPEQKGAAFGELAGYLDGLVTDKEKSPTDDVIGRQILRQRESGEVRHKYLVELAFLLLLTGHETTTNSIALGVVTLLRHPEQLEKLVRDPSKTPAAVEELLRLFPIAEVVSARFALEDVELGGVLIRAGEGVVPMVNSAHRDPEIFENPDVFDIERDSQRHVGFGFGPHQCLGQNLSRLELRVTFDTLFRRIPSLRLAGPIEDVPFKDDGPPFEGRSALHGVRELPVTWD